MVKDSIVRVISVAFEDEYIELHLDELDAVNANHWSSYIAGTLRSLIINFPEITGADLVIGSDLPLGAGLSSSASLEIALIKFYNQALQLSVSGTSAALMGQYAENHFIGCNCGIMDQLICALGKRGKAMCLDCSDLTFEHTSLPVNYDLLIVDSKVTRELVDSAYNERRDQCESVTRYFGKDSLREVSLQMLNDAEFSLGDKAFRCARHVVTENFRVESAQFALSESDMKSLSILMADSHDSLKFDFNVTVPETDSLVEIISSVIGKSGGVRMTGGG